MKVFVYGSLLSGLGNHRLLSDAKKIGETRSPKNFTMIDLGHFPGVIVDETHPGDVVGEVYEVDDDTLRRLDLLEGYISRNPEAGLYNRMTISTEFGDAYIYTYNCRGREISPSRIVKDGDWKKHLKSKLTTYND